MANIKYADPTYTNIDPTDDDKVMFRTGAGADARGSLIQPKGYIDGLKLEWISNTQVRVATGAAYVPGPKRIAELSTAVTLTPSLSANTWYYVYLTVSGATVSAEAVSTAPASPYAGTARAKTGDTSRRFLASFRTNASSQILQFVYDSGRIFYQAALPSVLSNGLATASTVVSLADYVPSVCKTAMLRHTNNSATTASRMSNQSAIFPNYLLNFAPMADAYIDFVIDPGQSVTYWNGLAPPSQGVYIAVVGYLLER